MQHKFKLGDIVQLKSGGPAMTVAEIKNDYSGAVSGYRCEWFKGASKEVSNFGEETLQIYVAPKKP